MKEAAEYTYWIAIAHLPKWTTDRINRLIVQIVHDKKMSLEEFFNLNAQGWTEIFSLTAKEIADLEFTKKDLPRLAFIAEQLQSEGFDLIPLNSPEYPTELKENLKVKSSPPLLYVKGRKGLLKEDAVAIVGSRKAGQKALDFTDHVAKKSVKESKVIVSGFAKGVDKQALDSTLEANGKSIIVLPQGILTFQSGFKKYYQPIINGDVLVLSTFFPKAGWDVGLAMARNAYIYGLAKEIYVAESDSKGGTWEGAMDGLKRKRSVYVRFPEKKEKNANLSLINLGGIAVDDWGEKIQDQSPANEIKKNGIDESISSDQEELTLEQKILAFLTKGPFTAKEITIGLKLDWDTKKVTTFLKKNPNVKMIEGKPTKFSRTDATTLTLF
ncbi:Predicted Rossmann fold nucleotide-binding protein DprA/Smf involved in DNA uptake [Algoriphagus alkaliphilus]|uniref:Predicted Rossmann fold nucleotide-binding protein DprA/Smf involved in DNA uptake n=1 Tax=Algoriphagus alkaliphilus TaxID=279824 RepID=A0A1G5ZMJ1_9BACT|nr:DNA-processing protein DprA [Algoriphagus alkaliphilus]SDA96039.1 Predicted Rossmann fold nucleotide-binding protein DprA/Smf involved in DNA uptake [Algoriphagus alkaliphilus]